MAGQSLVQGDHYSGHETTHGECDLQRRETVGESWCHLRPAQRRLPDK